jgi:hypothetical protein
MFVSLAAVTENVTAFIFSLHDILSREKLSVGNIVRRKGERQVLKRELTAFAAACNSCRIFQTIASKHLEFSRLAGDSGPVQPRGDQLAIAPNYLVTAFTESRIARGLLNPILRNLRL